MEQSITAQEIKGIRSKYGLSQQSFARLLGIGEASMVRYENGQTPTKANANLIRAAAKPDFMLDCLERDGELIPQAQRDTAEKLVYAMVTFDEEGEVMDINELYMITLQQEILNEHAASVMADITRLLIEAENAGDEISALIFDDMLTYLADVKYQITGQGNTSQSTLAEIRGKIDCTKHLAFMRKARAA